MPKDAKPHTPHADEIAVHDARLMKAVLLAVAAYLLLGLMPIVRWSVMNHNWTPAGLDAGLLVICLLFGVGDFPRSLRPVRDWLGMVAIPVMYFELRYVIGGIGMARKDDRVVAWDRKLFKGDLWKSLAMRVHSLPVSELLHLSYLSYYALVFVPPVLLWAKGKRHQFTSTVVTIVITYLLCFCISIIMPVDGPRFVHGPAGAPSGPFRGLVLTLLGLFSSRGSAFPSSHVAASVAATWCALRFQRRVGYVMAPLTMGLTAGALYGGLHYGTDLLAGALVAVAGVAISWLLEKPGRPKVDRNSPDGTPVKVQIMRERMAQHGARRTRPLRPSQEVDTIPRPDSG